MGIGFSFYVTFDASDDKAANTSAQRWKGEMENVEI